MVDRRVLSTRCLAGLAAAACIVIAGLYAGGCQEGRRDVSARDTTQVYPPEPQVPRVIALGTLRGAPPASKSSVSLSMFLFGVEPTAPLTITSPTDLAAGDETLLICDNALETVFRWEADSGKVSEQRFHPELEHPIAVDMAPNGDRLVCERGRVVRGDADGNVIGKYAIESGAFKPADVLAVGDEVWVANLGNNGIEVFTAAGEHLRTIGGAGSSGVQFAMPRGMARTPDGNVCVVDMLNDRVQLLDAGGQLLRDIGRPGVAAGTFGRPKDVAVGPDGTIFVTDAVSQRVHAFAPDGAPLMAFGAPGSGIGELTLPGGIAVSSVAPQTEHPPPAESAPAYYVLVGEQLDRPGVRVYGWLANYEPDTSAPATETAVALRPWAGEGPAGPHWEPDSCIACHEEDDDEKLLPIAIDDVADLCLDCHEEHDEAPFLHTVDADTEDIEGLRIPAGWPLADGALTCITCHAIKEQQCDRKARRAAATDRMLRRFDQLQSNNICMACHVDPEWKGGPHLQLFGEGNVNTDACLVCHKEEPTVPDDGVRQFEPQLREVSGSCLVCHRRHWDYYPARHVDRLVASGARLSDNLPLLDGRIACYTCHNPHQVGLFPSGSELGNWATSAADSARYLRADRPALCLECHDK